MLVIAVSVLRQRQQLVACFTVEMSWPFLLIILKLEKPFEVIFLISTGYGVLYSSALQRGLSLPLLTCQESECNHFNTVTVWVCPTCQLFFYFKENRQQPWHKQKTDTLEKGNHSSGEWSEEWVVSAFWRSEHDVDCFPFWPDQLKGWRGFLCI